MALRDPFLVASPWGHALTPLITGGPGSAGGPGGRLQVVRDIPVGVTHGVMSQSDPEVGCGCWGTLHI